MFHAGSCSYNSAIGTKEAGGGGCASTFLEIAVVTLENDAAQKNFFVLPPRYYFLPTVVCKIETFAFRKCTKTETATCLLVMTFTKGPGSQSFKSSLVFQEPSAFSFPASASRQFRSFYLGTCMAPFLRPSTSESVKKNNYGSQSFRIPVDIPHCTLNTL